MRNHYRSWGRFPKVAQKVQTLFWPDDAFRLNEIEGTVLPYGLGRSYGDVCLNENGTLLATRRLNRFLSLSPSGILRCESGVSFAEMLEICVPRGWFPPVTPGTKFVTVGGAIANDVYGRNQHRAGSLGRHVLRFELARSNGERLLCCPGYNGEWFAATVGGLGLTGLILWAEIQLMPIRQRLMDVEAVPFDGVDEAVRLSRESESGFAYTAAWMDCGPGRAADGRGILFRGNHREEAAPNHRGRARWRLRVPFDFPGFVLNNRTIALFNWAVWRRQMRAPRRRVEDYETFLYPLDAVLDWNRLYGRKGLLQYQCVIPFAAAAAVEAILARVERAGRASSLAILKTFGNIRPPGMLSFCRPGIMLAMDFPDRGRGVFEMLAGLDEIVAAAGGLVCPAKDARMPAGLFQACYPQWEQFAAYVDPKFSSSFWRRVSARESGCAES